MALNVKIALWGVGAVVVFLAFAIALDKHTSPTQNPQASDAAIPSQGQPAQVASTEGTDGISAICHDVNLFASASKQDIEAKCGRSVGGKWISIIEPVGMSYRLKSGSSNANIVCNDHGGGMIITINIAHPTEELLRSMPPVAESMDRPIEVEDVFEGSRTVSFLDSWSMSKGDDGSVGLLSMTGAISFAYNISHSKRMALVAPFLNIELNTAGLDQNMFVSDCLSSNSSGQLEEIQNSVNADTPIPGVDSNTYTAVPDALYAQLVHDGYPEGVSDPMVTELVDLQSDGKDLPLDFSHKN